MDSYEKDLIWTFDVVLDWTDQTVPFAWIFLLQIDSSHFCIALVPFLGSLSTCQVLVSSLPSQPQSSERIDIGSALLCYDYGAVHL